MQDEANVAVLPGPAVFWLFLWLANNVGLTLMNKAFFVYWGFTFPVSLSAVHMWSTAIFSIAFLKITGMTRRAVSWKQRLQLISFSVLFCLNIILGNLALRYTSVSLVQVIRSVIPGLTLALSALILSKNFSSQSRLSVLFIVIGVALASFGEVEFSWVGFCLTTVVCFLSSLKSVLSSKFMIGELSFQEFDLLAHMSVYAAIQMTLLSFLSGELTEIAFDWWPSLDSEARKFSAALLVGNGCLAFLLNVANFVTTKKTSALTVTIAGNVKHVATILLSVALFQNPISALNAGGTLITIAAVVWYSYIDYSEKRAPTSMQISHQKNIV